MSCEAETTATEAPKRRNWNDEEDLILLRQVSADRPFAKEHGALRTAWAKVAITLMSCEGFTRTVDSKKIQNRFTALLEAHKEFNQESAAKSGVDEDETEKIMLLDDLTAQVAKVRARAAAKSDEKKAKKDESETADQLVRDRAMTTCTKRKAEDTPPPPPRRNADTCILEFLKRESDNAKEVQAESLKLQRLQFEEELAERRRERNDLREERQRQRDDDERRRREEREEARAEREAADRREERWYQLHLAELETRKLELELMLKRQG